MLALGLLACSGAAAREPKRIVDPVLPGDRALERTLVAGTLVEATVANASSRRPARGDTMMATVSGDVRNAERWTVIPAGSRVAFRIARWRPTTTVRDADPRIMLEMLFLTVRGRRYPLRATLALTSLAVYPPSGEVLVVAPETRILFVLAEGFTAARRTDDLRTSP